MSKSTTTTVPAVESIDYSAAHNELTVAAYKAAATPKDRAAVKKVASDLVVSSMSLLGTSPEMTADVVLARVAYWQRTVEACRVDSAKSEREAIPAFQVIALRAAQLRIASENLTTGFITPEGLDAIDVDLDAVKSAFAELLDNPTDDVVNGAAKLAGAKITRSTERNSIASVIERAFDGKPVGTLLRISEVARLGAIDGYKPSPGAVRAHFDSDRDGYVLVPSDDQGNPYRIQSV